jgi:hypothetical protein
MGQRSTVVQLGPSGRLFAFLIPLRLAFLWGRLWRAGAIVGWAIAFLLHVTIAVVVVFGVYICVEGLVGLIGRGKHEVHEGIGAVRPSESLLWTEPPPERGDAGDDGRPTDVSWPRTVAQPVQVFASRRLGITLGINSPRLGGLQLTQPTRNWK